MKRSDPAHIALNGIRGRLFADLRRSDQFRELRNEYLRIIAAHSVPFTENITNLNDWLVYVYYCLMIDHVLPTKQARIVDWGGGNGQITQILRAMGYTDVLNYLQYKPEAYECFQEAFQIPTAFGDRPEAINLGSSSVDALISSGVLEHVREDGVGREEVSLREIYRVLKPEGLLFIWNLPTVLSSSEIMCMLTKQWHHQYRFRKSDVVRLLGQAGFEILYLDKHTFLPGTAMALLQRQVHPVTAMKIDDRLSRVFPMSIFARNFGIVARKPVGSIG